MNKLIIPVLPRPAVTVSQVSEEMDAIQRLQLTFSPWPEFQYKPLVDFSIAHSGNHIFLKFYVTEKHVRAFNLQANDPVYNDSCVEFFISWGNDRSYYNLEFSCSGTCNFGFGPNRNERRPISKDLISQVRYQSVFKSVSTFLPYQVNWELCLLMPLQVFSFHNLTSFDEQPCRVNFFKCGDLLPEPHYLSWANITSDEPNFHLPEFFGEACFEATEFNRQMNYI
jgi:hypothetical protein